MNLSELRTALQERREDYSQSDAKLDRKLNQAYLDICSRRKWGWLRREYSYATTAPFESSITGGIQVLGTENGNAIITIQDAVNPGVNGVTLPANTLGKLIRIEDDFYRVINIKNPQESATPAPSITAMHLTLDRPLRCTVSAGTPPATSIHYIKVIYNEIALPVGTVTVVEAAMFDGGSTSYGTPLGMGAVGPINMLHLGRDVEGRPSSFSIVHKEPIPTPHYTLSSGPPSSGPGGSPATSSQGYLDLGKYTFWYTFFDETTGSESALSEGITPEMGMGADAAGNIVPLNSVSVSLVNYAQRQDLNLRWYRSKANEDIPYLVAVGASPAVISAPVAGEVTIRELCRRDTELSTRGPASASTMFMQFYPVPDGEYTVSVLTQVEAKRMGDDNDRPLFDAQYHGIILDGAEALMLEANDEQGRSGQSRQRYEMGIARMIQSDRMNQQRRVVFGGAKRARGKPTWWYGAFRPSGT